MLVNLGVTPVLRETFPIFLGVPVMMISGSISERGWGMNMQVELIDKRVPVTTDSLHLPILGRMQYVFKLDSSKSATYCDASLRGIASMNGAQMFVEGNCLILDTVGSNDQLAGMIMNRIQQTPAV